MNKILIFLILFASKFSFAEMITGEAYIDNKLIYIEKHNSTQDEKGRYLKLTTNYYRPDGITQFATITSDFKKSFFIPDYLFSDNRSGLFESSEFNETKNEVFIIRSKNLKKENGSVKVLTDTILGQGFHNYIVENFERLLIESRPINIILSTRFDFFKFNISKINQSNEKVEFIVKPNNFILRQIVTPIELTYKLPEKQLLRFKGLSNLENEKGDSQVVEINYKY